MDAILKKDGTLVITPTDTSTFVDIEAYALKQWSENFGKGDNSSLLEIKIDKTLARTIDG